MVRASLAILLTTLAFSAMPDRGPATGARQKFRLISQERVPRGSKVTIGQDELNAYVRSEIGEVVREGVRDPHLELGRNRASAFAHIDFARLRQAQGQPMNRLMEVLLGGEHSVRVDAQIRSGNGFATVDVERVEVSGIVLTGRALDYVIRNFLWSYYPDAKVGRPFELDHGIDRLEVEPSHVNVIIGK